MLLNEGFLRVIWMNLEKHAELVCLVKMEELIYIQLIDVLFTLTYHLHVNLNFVKLFLAAIFTQIIESNAISNSTLLNQTANKNLPGLIPYPKPFKTVDQNGPKKNENTKKKNLNYENYL